MALDGTLSGLIASVTDALNRTDLSNSLVTDWVTMCEADMNRRLRTRRQVTVATQSYSSEYGNAPADFLAPISLTLLDSNGSTVVLDNLSPEELAERKPFAGTYTNNGTPTAYAIVGGQFQFFPAFTTATNVTVTYYAKVPALSGGANWVSQNYIDAYYYGTLAHSAPYLMDDARLQTWGTLYERALGEIQSASKHESYGASLKAQSLLVI